jgi:aminoglycoside 6'-N-acetyltransferase I
MLIHPLQPSDHSQWCLLRAALWPELSERANQEEMAEILANPQTQAVFVAEGESGRLVGFVEVATRDWAEGCITRPVGYLEGWYVTPEYRRQGVGRALVAAAEAWARARGHREMASDAVLANDVSHRAHARLGYQEVVRLVLYRKTIDGP